jgi:C4-dicarboxylate-specific signal transduction histidine kinase
MQRAMEQLTEQTTNYRGLSTLGIAAATFGHETEVAIDQVKTSLDASASCLDHQPPRVAEAQQEIIAASENADRVAAWGAFAMQRTSFDKRKQTPLKTKKIIQTIVDELTPAFVSSGIELKAQLKVANGHGYAMDLESIVVNLLTNAYYFTKKSKRARKVRISTRPVTRDSRKGLDIVVGDSGPGVDPKIADAIWEPLFTTKVDREGRPEGTGLGLNIIDSIVNDWRGTREMGTDPVLKGARFAVWLPLLPE